MDLRPNRGRTATEPTEPAPAMVDFSGPAGVELFRLYGDYAPMEHSLIVEMTWADERDNGTETRQQWFRPALDRTPLTAVAGSPSPVLLAA